MQSLQVLTTDPAEAANYTELLVLQSGAGYYVGTLYQVFEADGTLAWVEPGSRDSGYFATKEGAEEQLRRMEAGELEGVRLEP